MKTIVSILNGDCIKSEHNQVNMFSTLKKINELQNGMPFCAKC
jgi:hypothetical protein